MVLFVVFPACSFKFRLGQCLNTKLLNFNYFKCVSEITFQKPGILILLNHINILSMKHIFTLILSFLSVAIFAQNDAVPTDNSRNALDASLEPFYHGVASGDPISDAVIIWTRITLNSTGPVDVNWRMATDTLFANVVVSGMVTTDSTVDWTVNVDVTGLSSDTWYYYDFEHNGVRSLIGRTRTAPTGGVDHLRFGVVSCQSYEHGYYHAYRDMATRNDMDCILHLGDYIYEYEAGGYSSNIAGRASEPVNEIVDLSDYRMRYSHYRLDPDLRAAHQQYPFIVIWDDHETANNSYMDGAGNHTEGSEGLWVDRKAHAIQANREWLPTRLPDANNPERRYRDFSFGDLADLEMLDTRLEGRDEQGAGADNDRNLLGYEQRQWLYDNLSNSTAQWKIIGQQVMVAPLLAFGIPVNDDQWDGYPAERDSLFTHLVSNSIDNAVVLTGDIHTSWGNDLPGDNYDSNTGAGSVAVEFVVTSVTSPGLPIPLPANIIQGLNPHIKYTDLVQNGYMILDLTTAAAQSDWHYVSDVANASYNGSTWGAGWLTNDGVNHLVEATSEAPADLYPPLAPGLYEEGVGIDEKDLSPVIVSAYPNPFIDRFVVQFNLFESENVQIQLTDISGKVVLREDFGETQSGLNYMEINVSEVSSGLYIFTLQTGSHVVNRRMSKMK
jgi:alkaline phosphatase D